MTEAELRAALMAEGVSAAALDEAGWSTWSNGPGDRYAVHDHRYDKVLLALAGSITFELPAVQQALRLAAGQRLDLPAGTDHGAVAGPDGVRCLELHLPAGTLGPPRKAAETATGGKS
ncbi:MAG: cupin domain-containing protein [Candidatus Limnocylindrales bacterium]